MIAFTKDGDAVVIMECDENNDVKFIKDFKTKATSVENIDELSKVLTGYVILAKELSNREKEELRGHWF